MKCKIVLLASGILIVIIGIGACIRYLIDTQKNLVPVKSDSIVASLPIVSSMPLTVEITDGVIFGLDTGSDVSTITVTDLEKLKARGYRVTERNAPVIGRTSDGKINAYMKRYVIDLPLQFIDSHYDLTGTRIIRHPIPERNNVLSGAEFVLLDNDSATSAIGIDILQHFAMEYLYDKQLIRLHISTPEGYQDFTPFHSSFWPNQILWPGKRFYLDLEVDNLTDTYFIDTGLRNAPVKLPSSRAPRTYRRSGSGTLSVNGEETLRTENVWIEVGNRAGTLKAFFVEDSEESYSLNPINMFTQDILLDFPRAFIAIPQFVRLPHHKAPDYSKRDSTTTTR